MLEPEAKAINIHLRALVGERNPYSSPGDLDRAGDYIRDQFLNMGLKVLEETVPFDGLSSRNVLGIKEGTDASRRAFVLAAHYDTVEGTPGADDNASAVAALLEIARCLEPSSLKFPLIFAGFTLEEHGFVGSGFFIDQAKKKKVRFHGMIALEMIGFRNHDSGSQSYPVYVDSKKYPETGDFIAVVGNEPSAKLTQSAVQVMRQTIPSLPVEMLLLPGRGDEFTEARLSDHSPFWEYDTPAIMVTDTAFFRNPNYHQATDTLETLDIEFIREVSHGIAGFLESYLGDGTGG